MPDVYRYESGDVRLDILNPNVDTPSYPSGAGITIEALQDNAVLEIKDYKWEADKWPVGMYAPPRVKVKMHAPSLPSTLISWLREAVTKTVVLSSPGDPVESFQFERGPACVLWINAAPIWYGVMDATVGLMPDLSTGELEVEFADLAQAALKVLNFAHIQAADQIVVRYNFVPKRCAIERVWWDTTHDVWGMIGHVPPANVEGQRFWFVDNETLHNRWRTYLVKTIFAMGARNSTLTVDCDIDGLYGTYKIQSYSDEAAGSAIGSPADVYRLIALTDGDTGNEPYIYSWYDSLIDKYGSFHDWLADLCSQSMKQCAWRYVVTAGALNIELANYTPLGVLRNADLSRTGDPTIREVKPALMTAAVRTATGSTDMTIEDDYSSHEEQRGGRNDNGHTIPVNSTSSPVICDYIRALNDNGRHGQARGFEYTMLPSGRRPDSAYENNSEPRSHGLIAYQYTPRWGGFYYLARPLTPGDYYPFDHPEMIRCHSHAADATAPTAPSSTPALPMANVEGKATTATAWAIADQQTFGPLVYTPQRMLELFGDANSSTVEFSIERSRAEMHPLDARYIVDLAAMTDITGWLDNAPTTWTPTRIEWADKNTMRVTAYGK